MAAKKMVNEHFPNKIFIDEDDAYDLDEHNHPERFIVVDRDGIDNRRTGGGGGAGSGSSAPGGGPGGKEEYDPGFDWAPNLGDIPEILTDFSLPVGTVKTLSDGSLVVDVEIETTTIPGASGYEFRIAEDSDVTQGW